MVRVVILMIFCCAANVLALELNAGPNKATEVKYMNKIASSKDSLVILDTKVDDRINLKRVMELGGKNILNMGNPDRNYLPYFRVMGPGEVSHDLAWNHNIGRWWDTMLRLEATIDFKVPAEREKVMVENLRKFCENPDNLCFGPRDNWLGIENQNQENIVYQLSMQVLIQRNI